MTNEHHRPRPGLLVSVRNAAEALAALAGGANVIDVKEPQRGALGAADASTVAAVVHAVSGRVPVTAAVGELIDSIDAKRQPIPAGVSFFKIGLAGCRRLPDWRSHWRDTIAALVGPSCREGPGAARHTAPTAVAYADWQAAGAPEPDEVLTAAVEAGCPALLVDTWDKSAGALFDHWPVDQVTRFVQTARSHGLIVVLAGSLAGENFLAAARLAPDLVGVRAAACDGGRRGIVVAELVRALQHAIQTATIPAVPSRAKIFLDNAPELRILESSSAHSTGRSFFASRHGGR